MTKQRREDIAEFAKGFAFLLLMSAAAIALYMAAPLLRNKDLPCVIKPADLVSPRPE